MEFYEVLRSTFAAREFTADPLPDDVLARILDQARFAPSIYPFAWNILLASRHEGFAGTITTLATAREPQIKALLGIPRHIAVCAVMPLGRPVRTLSRLKRRPVAEFTKRER